MHMKNIRGVTLVELLVSMFVAMILLGSVYMAVNVAQRSSAGIERKVTAQQDVKPALDLMAMEIGMAGYNPNYASGLWLNPATCATAANQNYKGIQEATTNAITIEMDITDSACTATDGDGAISRCNEIIRYEYLSGATDQRITREEISCVSGARTTGNAQPFLGDAAASGNPRTVLVINNTAGIPVFRYYDGTGTEIAAGSLPGAIPDIRRVEITLAVETAEIDPNTGQRRRLIYTTSVIPRNNIIIP